MKHLKWFDLCRKQEFLDHEPECGVSRHPHFSKRIIGGEKAKFSELPWQAHIRISSYQCGGVLLNHWHIATAAHCVHRAKLNKISVILGEYDTKDGEEEPLGSETFKVDHIVIHPDFRSVVLEIFSCLTELTVCCLRYMLTQPDRFDVALLHLDRPVFYQDNIIPICLPPPDISLTGKVGLVAGWGKTDNTFGKTGTNILHKVLVPIIKNEDCIRWHEDKNILVQVSQAWPGRDPRLRCDCCVSASRGDVLCGTQERQDGRLSGRQWRSSHHPLQRQVDSHWSYQCRLRLRCRQTTRNLSQGEAVRLYSHTKLLCSFQIGPMMAHYLHPKLRPSITEY